MLVNEESGGVRIVYLLGLGNGGACHCCVLFYSDLVYTLAGTKVKKRKEQ